MSTCLFYYPAKARLVQRGRGKRALTRQGAQRPTALPPSGDRPKRRKLFHALAENASLGLSCMSIKKTYAIRGRSKGFAKAGEPRLPPFPKRRRNRQLPPERGSPDKRGNLQLAPETSEITAMRWLPPEADNERWTIATHSPFDMAFSTQKRSGLSCD